MSRPPSSLFRSVRRPPRRRWLGVAKGVLALLVVAVVVAGGIVGLVWAEATWRLGGEAVTALAADDVEALGTQAPRAPAASTTVLVALVEEHDPVEARGAPLAGPVALVQVAEQREDAAVVLLPDDLEVAVDGEGDVPLAEVHPAGGLDLLVRAVVDYTGVGVDHAVAASVDALPRLTEALGGVERCDEGACRTLDADAVRLGLAEGDPTQRVHLVAEVLRSLAGQVNESTPLRSPLRARAVVAAVAEEVVTDVSLRGTRLLDVAEALAEPRHVTVASLPTVTNPETDRLVIRAEQAETLFQHLRQGTPLDGAALDEQRSLPPEGVTLVVRNGAGIAGLAGRVESQLQGAGFTVVDTDNAASFDHDRTVVAYGADDPEAEVTAILVAEHLDGARLEPRDRAPTFEGEPVVEVIAGHDLDDGEDA